MFDNPPMTKDGVKENLVINIDNLGQEQIWEEQVSLNLIQNTMKIHQLLFDAPPNSLLDSKKSNYVNKSGSNWNLVPLLASSTKGGDKGVLKAPGLD